MSCWKVLDILSLRSKQSDETDIQRSVGPITKNKIDLSNWQNFNPRGHMTETYELSKTNIKVVNRDTSLYTL